jgi:hypothetical protein
MVYLKPKLKKDGKPIIHEFPGMRFQELTEDCIPDFTFSWINRDFLKILRADYGEKSNWFKNLVNTFESDRVYHTNALFTSLSPGGSFGYEPVQIRIKLKKNLRYLNPLTNKTNEACNYLSEKFKQDTVLVVQKYWGDQDFSAEYDFCSFGPVHSWSYFRKKNYDEIVKEYLRYKELPDPTGKMLLYIHQNKRPIFFPVSMLGEAWREKEFKKKLIYYFKKINSGQEGEILYDPDLSSSEKKEDHYFTKKPFFWNFPSK